MIEDKFGWPVTVFDDPDGWVYVWRRCPKCRRFISKGDLYTSSAGNVKLENWNCHKCGEVTPDYDWM